MPTKKRAKRHQQPYAVVVYFPHLYRPPHIDETYLSVRDYISTLVGITYSSKGAANHFGDLTWSIAFRGAPPNVEKFVNEHRTQWPGGGLKFVDCFELTFLAEFPGDDELLAHWNSSELRAEDAFPLWRSFLLEAVESEVFALQIALDLSFPGAGHEVGGRGAIVADERLSEFRGVFSPTRDRYWFARKSGLQAYEPMPFELAWNWLKTINGFRHAVADTPVARALASLTYLYDDNFLGRRFMSVAWACAGLEALFGDDSNARGQQLVRKIPLFLQINMDSKEWKEQFSRLYAVRSAIIHGNRGLSSAVAGYDEIPEKHSEEEGEAEWLAHFCLSEGIRKCIREKINAPRFKLVLDSPNPHPSSAPQ